VENIPNSFVPECPADVFVIKIAVFCIYKKHIKNIYLKNSADIVFV